MRRKLRLIMLAAAVPVMLALIPGTSDAQHARGGRMVRPGGGFVVRGHIGGYWGAPYWGGFWWDPLWAGPYWGYPYYHYWGGGYYDNSAELRIEVKPKEAQVYVDGYYAGIVDDFNGVFQRLHVRPGNHELALYLSGYRTVTQDLHLGVGQDLKIKFNMVPLGPGEPNQPPPQPTAPPTVQQGYGNEPGAPNTAAEPRRQVVPRRAIRPEPAEPGVAPPPENPAEQGQGYGSLVVRVQPAGADIVIDGERWQGPEGSERLVVQVAEGSHRIEVRKEGYAPFSTTVRVRSGETVPVNVSLPPRGQ